MKEEIFAVSNPDDFCSCDCMAYLIEDGRTPVKMRAFADAECLCGCVKEQKIGILLIPAGTGCGGIRGISLPERERIPDLDLKRLYGYRPSGRISPGTAGHDTGDQPQPRRFSSDRRRTKLYGIYSPIGRSRKTTFALALGEILAESKRTLYLNFEEFAGFEELFQTKYRTDLTDLICSLAQKENSLIYKFNSVVQTFHELEYIPPALFPFDIREISAEAWMEFLRELTDYLEYEVILLDLGTQVNGLFRIMKECDRIYMPVLDDMISRAKLKQYEHLLKMLKMEEIREKTVRVRPPAQPVKEGDGDLILQLSRGEMGNYVRHLLREEQENG